MKFLIALMLISFKVFACEVTLPSNLVFTGSGLSHIPNLKSQECTEAEIAELTQTLVTVDGRIASYQLEEMLKSKGHTIFVNPRSIQVNQLKSIVREQLKMPEGYQVKTIGGVSLPSVIELSIGDRIEVRCSNCLFGSEQPIQVMIHGFDGQSRSHFAKVDFKKMVKAYRAVVALPSFITISPNQMLKEEFVEAIPHTELLSDVSGLKYYKTNKPIKAGEIIRMADLNAVNIVKAGLKTDVIIENSLVRIKTQGVSRQNGAIGDLVEVFHPQKNKKYQGKVIDVNKVLVEL